MKTYEWRMLLGVVGKKKHLSVISLTICSFMTVRVRFVCVSSCSKKRGRNFQMNSKKKKKTCAQKTRRYEDMYQHRSNNLNGSATEKPYFTPFLTVKGFLLASHGTGWCETAPDGTVYYEHYLAGLDRKR